LNNCQELAAHLDTLISRATTLRGSLTEEEKKESTEMLQEAQVSNTELVITNTGSIDVHAELLVPTMTRGLPFRFNMEAAPESLPQASNSVENSSTSRDLESGRPNGEIGNRQEQSRIFNASQILARQQLQNSTSGSIFNMLVNRFRKR